VSFKRKKDFKMPFAVMRQVGMSLEDQLFNGFSGAIRGGAYADGETLPGIRKLAELSGVSLITVQNAVKRLCREGLVEARPRIGLRVCCSGRRFWKGSVLGVKAGPPGMYFTSVLENSMSSVLRRNGWLYASVDVSPRMEDADVMTMDMMLDASIKLMVLFEAPPQLIAHVSGLGIPFVEVRSHVPSDKAVFAVAEDLSSALSELARTMRSAGVRTVLSVYQHPAAKKLFSGELERAGFDVRNLPVRLAGGSGIQESVQRAGLQTFGDLLSNGGIGADAVVCNDDYLAAGILSAFDRNGVRMPDDVRFATLANKGLGPVHAQDLTRIEYDPAQSGITIGESVVSYLDAKKVVSCSVSVEFKHGETI
jgi:DNA-binding LacI/PurR family transcriptional regulator